MTYFSISPTTMPQMHIPEVFIKYSWAKWVHIVGHGSCWGVGIGAGAGGLAAVGSGRYWSGCVGGLALLELVLVLGCCAPCCCGGFAWLLSGVWLACKPFHGNGMSWPNFCTVLIMEIYIFCYFLCRLDNYSCTLCTVFGMFWTHNANIIILDRLFYAIYSNWDLNNKEESWPKWIKVGNIHIKDQNNIKMLPYSITRMSFCFSISFLRLNLWFFLSCLGDSTFVLRLERWKSKNVSTFPHFW